MDLEVKDMTSDEAMRVAARGMCFSYRTLVGMQKWVKEREGSTMDTCSR